MFSQLLGFLLLIACQVTINESRVTQATPHEHDTEGIPTTLNETVKPIPEGYTRFPDVNAAYKIYVEATTWYEGRDRCIAEGAKLANADSVAKIRHINSLQPSSPINWLHVGFFRDESKDAWISLDTNAPVTSLPWKANEPGEFGDCAGISIATDGLVNYGCNWKYEFFVCEVPL